MGGCFQRHHPARVGRGDPFLGVAGRLPHHRAGLLQVVIQPGLTIGVGQPDTTELCTLRGQEPSQLRHRLAHLPLALGVAVEADDHLPPVKGDLIPVVQCHPAAQAVSPAPVPHTRDVDDAQPARRTAIALLDPFGDPQRLVGVAEHVGVHPRWDIQGVGITVACLVFGRRAVVGAKGAVRPELVAPHLAVHVAPRDQQTRGSVDNPLREPQIVQASSVQHRDRLIAS